MTNNAAKSIGVGVVGLGFMGRTHLAAYAAAARDGLPCEIVALADMDRGRLAGASSASGGGNLETGASNARLFDPAKVKAFNDPSSLFRDPDVDLVSICTHTDTHVDLAVAALRAGKHVLVEKPVALRSEEVRRLAEAAKSSGKLCMPAMCMRFWPGWTWLKDRVRDGSLGAIRGAAFQRLGAPPDWGQSFYRDPTRSGGSLFDLHIHDVDIIYWLLGKPAAVNSTGTAAHVTTLYRFENGPEHVAAEGGQDHAPGFGFRMRFTVVFERATAEFDLGRSASPLLVYREGRTETPALPTLGGYDAEVRHLVDAIAMNKPARELAATLEDALAVTKILEAERKSLETGAPVGLN